MIEIKDLLYKFKNILFLKEERKKIIIQIILEITELKLKTEEIEVKNGILYLNIKSIYKNEIFIKQDKILLEFKKILNKKAPIEIR